MTDPSFAPPPSQLGPDIANTALPTAGLGLTLDSSGKLASTLLTGTIPASLLPATGSHCCQLSRVGTDTTVSGVNKLVGFDTADIDTDGYANLANNRIVIPAGLGGTYRIVATTGVVDYAPVQTIIAKAGSPTWYAPETVVVIATLAVGDALTEYEYQASGVNHTTQGGSQSPRLSVELLS
jgi:hypothetical protein